MAGAGHHDGAIMERAVEGTIPRTPVQLHSPIRARGPLDNGRAVEGFLFGHRRIWLPSRRNPTALWLWLWPREDGSARHEI